MFKFLAGEDLLSIYESTHNKYRYACSKCSSPIYATVGKSPESVKVRLGGLDFEPETNITAHMWVNEKPEWCLISDNLPQYETIYDRSKD